MTEGEKKWLISPPAFGHIPLSLNYTVYCPRKGANATMGRPLKPWLPKATGQPREIRSAVGYIRVSTADQARDGFGLDAQRDAITAEVTRRGWTLLAIHVDAGISGTKAERPGLDDALADVQSGRADALVANELSRVGRPAEASSLHKFIETLKSSGASFVSVTEPWIGNDPLTIGIAIAMAQHERLRLLKRTAGGRISKAERGGVVGRPPFGYRVADARTPEARFVIVEAEAVVVRRIIRERAAGTACHVVAAHLQADGVPSPSGMGRWTASRVSGIATNPAYRGILRWREGTREISVPGAIPVIADDTVASWDGKRWRLPHPQG